ncbi:MAG: glycosyltransferase family 2 protein [Bacteroidetes bacterium]|nr:MAG: glycosyltransferase family 2 protein [Bacteroidota bacterium]
MLTTPVPVPNAIFAALQDLEPATAAAQQPWVGIGILNWNGQAYLEQFLPFLYQITYPHVRIYVIDNASTDGSVAYLKHHHPGVTVIHTGGNFGVPGGYNRGFSQMKEPYLLMLNSDVEVAPNFLEPLVELLQSNSKIAMVQSTLLAHGNRQQFEYGGAAGGLLDVLGYAFCRGRMFGHVEQNNNQYPTQSVFWAGGACALIRKSAYDAVGGMYEWFFMHFEEIDLCWRFQTAGFSVWCSSQSLAWHVGGGTLSYQSPKKTYYNFKNNLVMVVRNSPTLYLLWWLPARLFLDGVAALQFLLTAERANAAAVCKAWYGFFAWWFGTPAPKFPVQKKSLIRMAPVYKRLVVFSFFVQKKRTYNQLIKKHPYIHEV